MQDAEGDTQLRKQLQSVLKMNQDQWTRAFEHAMRAVDVDNTARLWLPAPSASSSVVGLVFSCKRGKVDMQRPIGTPHMQHQW